MMKSFYLPALTVFALTMSTCHAQTPNIQRLGEIEFTLAPGLTIEKVADQPLIKWPVVADWDSLGRLVVVESGGVERPIEEHNKQLLHRVIRLVDDDQDGKFDRRIVAADQLPFPEGVLCLDRDLLVCAPPNIWKLTDADGDGVCESREVWFEGQTITGCANDLHGPYLGRDGWVYWCKGAFAEQTHETRDGIQTDSAAHIYRRRIEGGPIEAVMSGGMDNPVGFAITPEGERFFTSTFLQHPGDGKRDGIAHAIYGGVYGKQQRVIDDLVRTGPLLPITIHLGPAAPSGLRCLASNQLVGTNALEKSTRTLVAAQFNLQKVSAHRLLPSGASFASKDSDLLIANRIDFHPTDILEDTDGSLLIIDTGGWYGLCCPTSRVDQQTAGGGIYRLRRRASTEGVANVDIEWETATLDTCVSGLDDPRPWVARMAALRLSGWKDAAVERLSAVMGDPELPLEQRLRRVWALSSIGTPDALGAISGMLTDEQPSIVQAACHVLAVHRYQPAKATLESLLQHTDPAIVRAAAEALTHTGDEQTVAALMHVLESEQTDPILLHSCLYALIAIDTPTVVAKYLHSESAFQRAAALRVLDQLHDGQHLTREPVIEAAMQPGPAQSLAIEILGRHPQWIEAALPVLGESPRAELLPLVTAWSSQPLMHARLAEWITQRQDATWKQSLGTLLTAFTGQAPPTACVEPLREWLVEEPLVLAPTLRSLDLTSESCQPLVAALTARVQASKSVTERIELLLCLPTNHGLQSPQLAAELVDQFLKKNTHEPTVAGQALQRLSLDAQLAQKIVGNLEQLAPRELAVAIEIVSSVGDDQADIALLNKLPQLAAARTLPAGFLTNLYRSDRVSSVHSLAKSVGEQLAAPDADIAEKVQQTLKRLPPGDPVRGLETFRSAKAACASCHQLGYVGGRIGPELTHIARSRTREALLEAILFPSSRIEQSYQPLQVLTTDGETYNGLLIGSFGDGLELQIAADKTQKILYSRIEAQKPSSVSVMPAGMMEVLSEQQLADLLSLLESGR
ncbi:MAG: HEAT repeat domain-containing protein [Pirellulaceae bacterium]